MQFHSKRFVPHRQRTMAMSPHVEGTHSHSAGHSAADSSARLRGSARTIESSEVQLVHMQSTCNELYEPSNLYCRCGEVVAVEQRLAPRISQVLVLSGAHPRKFTEKDVVADDVRRSMLWICLRLSTSSVQWVQGSR